MALMLGLWHIHGRLKVVSEMGLRIIRTQASQQRLPMHSTAGTAGKGEHSKLRSVSGENEGVIPRQ